jgi:hypothetical protein
VWIDFKNAFNTIRHEALKEALLAMGVPNTEFLMKMLSESTYTLCLPWGKGDKVALMRGVKQGDSMSPLLFILLMQPLLQRIRDKCHGYRYAGTTAFPNYSRDPGMDAEAFADDVLLASDDPVDDMGMMVEITMDFSEWAGLEPNAAKCGSLVIGLHNVLSTGMKKLKDGSATRRGSTREGVAASESGGPSDGGDKTGGPGTSHKVRIIIGPAEGPVGASLTN